jgi:hypothetical protein
MNSAQAVEAAHGCPACGARLDRSAVCRRCKSDLELLQAARGAYERAYAECLGAMAAGDFAGALGHAETAHGLYPSEATRRLAAVCHLQLGQWQGAIRLAAESLGFAAPPVGDSLAGLIRHLEGSLPGARYADVVSFTIPADSSASAGGCGEGGFPLVAFRQFAFGGFQEEAGSGGVASELVAAPEVVLNVPPPDHRPDSTAAPQEAENRLWGWLSRVVRGRTAAVSGWKSRAGGLFMARTLRR